MYYQRCIEHNYHDHSQDVPVKNIEIVFRSTSSKNEKTPSVLVRRTKLKKAYSAQMFPAKLYKLLEAAEGDNDPADILSWKING